MSDNGDKTNVDINHIDGKPPLDEKMTDILNPGYEVEFDPTEAELAGAFKEEAISEKDAAESSIDVQSDQ